MTGIIEFIGHISYVIFAFGTGFRNIVYLRTSLIVASVLQIFYTIYSLNDVFKTPIVWSVAIIVINLFQVAYIIYNKKFMNLTHDEREIFKLMGGKMDIINFKKFMKMCNWMDYREDTKLITEKEPIQNLYYLAEGEVEVRMNEKNIAVIRKGNFLGEMSFLTGELPSASVATLTQAKIISWDKSRLKIMMDRNDDFRHEVYSIFSKDLIEKIINLNKQSILKSVFN